MIHRCMAGSWRLSLQERIEKGSIAFCSTSYCGLDGPVLLSGRWRGTGGGSALEMGAKYMIMNLKILKDRVELHLGYHRQ